jgi:hypothetical protein
VVQRWHQLFHGCVLSQRFLNGERLTTAELDVFNTLIDTWRERLCSISWFMRVLNEGIARASNKEDDCTGRFWEGRFKCQALLDEKALIACAAYVDLNPIRAKMAATPEASAHTSIKQRIDKAQAATQPNHVHQQVKHLLPFAGNPRLDMPKGLPFRLTDYLDLVDWTGRQIRADKRGAISTALPPILERLQIEPAQWLLLTTRFESRFRTLVGAAYHVRTACETLRRRWAQGVRACEDAFPV